MIIHREQAAGMRVGGREEGSWSRNTGGCGGCGGSS